MVTIAIALVVRMSKKIATPHCGYVPVPACHSASPVSIGALMVLPHSVQEPS